MQLAKKKASLGAFFSTHPVFRLADLLEYMSQHGRPMEPKTRKNLLHYYLRRGAIQRIRRGLYCSVPPGAGGPCPVDSYLLASRLTSDSILAYHAALELHGRSYSVQNRLTFLTTKLPAGHKFEFRGNLYQAVRPPSALVKARETEIGVTSEMRSGLPVRVTGLERTFVDTLDRPRLSGGWEEVWRSLETIPYLDVDLVARYAFLIGKRKTIALVGFFLEQHRETLLVDERYFKQLHRRRPRQPLYATRGEPGEAQLVSNWNIILPRRVVRRSWEEPT